MCTSLMSTCRLFVGLANLLGYRICCGAPDNDNLNKIIGGTTSTLSRFSLYHCIVSIALHVVYMPHLQVGKRQQYQLLILRTAKINSLSLSLRAHPAHHVTCQMMPYSLYLSLCRSAMPMHHQWRIQVFLIRG